MRILQCLPALVLVATACASAQTFQASQAYTNAALGLSLRYPAAFNRETPQAVAPYENAIFALHPEADPAHLGADPCAPVLLTLGANLDRKADAPKKGQAPTVQAKGTLTLSEVSRTCLDKEALDDATLSTIVATQTKLEGLRPLGRVRNDLVADSTVWWSATAGFNKGQKGKRVPEAGTIILGSAATTVHGHILILTVTANDPELFNRLVNLSISTDGTTYAPLVHYALNVPNKTDVASR